MKTRLFLLCLLGAVGCASSTNGVSIPIEKMDNGEEIGTVVLSDEEEGTQYAVRFHGLSPSENYLVTLHGGSCESRSASFTRIADVTADGVGQGTARGYVRFRDSGTIALKDVADGAHVVVVESAELTACGVIPSIK